MFLLFFISSRLLYMLEKIHITVEINYNKIVIFIFHNPQGFPSTIVLLNFSLSIKLLQANLIGLSPHSQYIFPSLFKNKKSKMKSEFM